MFFMRSQHLLHHLWLPAQLQGAGPLSLQVLRPHQPSWRSTFNSLQSGHRQSIEEPIVNWTLKRLPFQSEKSSFQPKSAVSASTLSMRIRTGQRFFNPNFRGSWLLLGPTLTCTHTYVTYSTVTRTQFCSLPNFLFALQLHLQSQIMITGHTFLTTGLHPIEGQFLTPRSLAIDKQLKSRIRKESKLDAEKLKF